MDSEEKKKDEEDNIIKEIETSGSGNEFEKEKIKNENILSIMSRTRLIGLKNQGNSCYFNSIIQCLTYTNDLTNYFLSPITKEELNKESNLLIQSYYSFLKNICLEKENNLTESFEYLYDVFIQSHPQFSNNTRQDAFELLTILLNEFNQELRRPQLNNQIEEEDTEISESQKAFKAFKRENNSIITDLFYGQIESNLHCLGCNHVIKIYENFNSLMLSIPASVLNMNFAFISLNDKMPTHLIIQVLPNTLIKQIKDIIIRKYLVTYDKLEAVVISSKNEIEEILDDYAFPLLIYSQEKSIAFYEKQSNEEHSVYYQLRYRNKLLFPNKRISIPSKSLQMMDLTKEITDEISQKTTIKDIEKQITFKNVERSKGYDKKFDIKLNNDNQTIGDYFKKDDKYSIIIVECLQEIKFKDQSFVENRFKEDTITIYNCIEMFETPSIIDNWKCSKCKQSIRMEKQNKISILPKYLIIRLKKQNISLFKNIFVKQNQYVECNANLNIFIESNQKNMIPFAYTLYGVVNFICNFFHPLGHYIALCKQNDQWIEFDDLNITTNIDERNVITDDLNMLFYQAQNI